MDQTVRYIFKLSNVTPAAGRAIVERILRWCDKRTFHRPYGFLFLFAYIFLLRLPSEALPATHGGDAEKQSRVYRDGDAIILKLRRRHEFYKTM